MDLGPTAPLLSGASEGEEEDEEKEEEEGEKMVNGTRRRNRENETRKLISQDDDVGDKVAASRLAQLRKLVTVEVILFFYVFGAFLIRPTIDALVYRKVCLSHYDKELCDHLGNSSYKDEEDLVQKKTSHWFLAETLAFEIPSIFMGFFYGSVSDNVSRKAALLLPAIGQTLSGVNYVINSMWMELPVYYIVIGPFVSGMFGGWVSCGMAAFSYLSDVTSAQSRTKRIAIAESVAVFARSSASLISGKLLDKTGFTFVTSASLVMFGIMALYTLVWIQEPPSLKRAHNTRTWSSVCKTVCDPREIKNTVTCVFRKRADNGRLHVLLSLGILLTGTAAAWVEFAIGYLYVRRRPLLWSQTMYGYFAGFAAFLAAIGQLVVPVLRDRVGLRDTTCLILSYASFICAFVTMSFSVHTWTVFLAGFLGTLAHTGGLILRSMLSRMVEKDELGRMFAAFGALQSVSSMVGSLVYNSIYPQTLSWWPGFCFDFAAVLLLIPIILTLILGRDLHKFNWDAAKVVTLQTSSDVLIQEKENLLGEEELALCPVTKENGSIEQREESDTPERLDV